MSEALRARGVLVSTVEVSGGHHPTAGRAVARAYHSLLRAAPGLWGGLYRSRVARAAARAIRGAYLSAGGARRLRAGVRREAPDLIVCPQASVAAVFSAARARAELAVPVVAALTDYGAHPFWADPPADLTLAPSEDAAAALAALGVPRASIRVTGLPIHAAFAAPPSRAAARARLGLPASAPVVVVSGGSNGHGAVDRAAASLLAASPRATVLALCGANDRLRRALSSRADAGGRLRVFGPQPPELVAAMLAAADAHLGKPGGLSAAESLALGVPMVLSRVLPGQEEANARALLRAGAALDGGGPERAARACAALLDDRERLAALRAAAARAGRPDSAGAAADAIAAFARTYSAASSTSTSLATSASALNGLARNGNVRPVPGSGIRPWSA